MNIIRASRIERSLIPVSSIIIALAFANRFNFDAFILIILTVLIYSFGGLMNAVCDRDYKVVKSAMLFVLFLVFLALAISHKKEIMMFVAISIGLSFIYNKLSRRILLGDSFILGLTHGAVPFIAASMLMKISHSFSISFGTYIFLVLFLLVPMKNFNGIREDRKRGYKTLITSYKNGKFLTLLMFVISGIIFIAIYFAFGLPKTYLVAILMAFVVKIEILFLVFAKEKIKAYELTRILVIILCLGIVYSVATELKIILLSNIVFYLYAIYLFKKLV